MAQSAAADIPHDPDAHATFRHAALGLQVVIEDYVHSALKIPVLIAMHFACFAIAVARVLATLRIPLAR